MLLGIDQFDSSTLVDENMRYENNNNNNYNFYFDKTAANCLDPLNNNSVVIKSESNSSSLADNLAEFAQKSYFCNQNIPYNNNMNESQIIEYFPTINQNIDQKELHYCTSNYYQDSCNYSYANNILYPQVSNINNYVDDCNYYSTLSSNYNQDLDMNYHQTEYYTANYEYNNDQNFYKKNDDLARINDNNANYKLPNLSTIFPSMANSQYNFARYDNDDAQILQINTQSQTEDGNESQKKKKRKISTEKKIHNDLRLNNESGLNEVTKKKRGRPRKPFKKTYIPLKERKKCVNEIGGFYINQQQENFSFNVNNNFMSSYNNNNQSKSQNLIFNTNFETFKQTNIMHNNNNNNNNFIGINNFMLQSDNNY